MIELLEYARALSAHRNFARAAKQLGISQPTLTRAIQELEAQLGAKLFDRTRRGVFPTAIGEVVIEGARRVSRCVEDLKKEIRSFEGMERAELKVGVGPLVAQTWMPDAVIAMLAKYPSIEVHVSTYEWWELAPQLLNHHCELVVGEITPDIKRHSEIALHPLPQRPLRFFCRSGHPLTRLKNPTIAQIGAYPMASTKFPLRAAEHFGGTRALGRLAPNGMYFEPQISCQTFDVCLRIIKATDNIGIAPLAQLTRLDLNESFFVIPFDAASLRTNYGVMHLRDRSLSPSAQAFVDQALDMEQAYFEPTQFEHAPASKRRGR
ncbi:MAG: LysR family transcriptional regulator [Hyphomicrobium sp.]|nr:LysR family transcriptional regulator [Hyphomicrobium sp.]